MVAPIVAAGLISGAGSLLGGIFGAGQSSAAREQADRFAQEALAALEAVGIPSAEAQRVVYETPELVFDYAPQLEQKFPQVKTKFEEIKVDPKYKQAQEQALSGLQQRADMGLTPEEKAQLNQMRRDVSQAEQGRQNTILQNMEQRGIGGSGAELAARLSSSQASTQNAAQESDRQAALQFAAKQAALQNLGNYSTALRGQEFGEQAQQASAADAIAQFNAMQQSGMQQRNIASQNQAALMKQQLMQEQANQKANASNQQQLYNAGLVQQDYQNRLAKAQGKAGALTGQAQQTQQAGATQAANTANIFGGLSKIAGGGYQAFSSKKPETDEEKAYFPGG